MSKQRPCEGQRELFFGGHVEFEAIDDARPIKVARRKAHQLSIRSRRICMTCPLAEIKWCAQTALECPNSYGVWAGVQLPGGQTRKLDELTAARAILAGIANGTINPYNHPGNADLYDSLDDPMSKYDADDDDTHDTAGLADDLEAEGLDDDLLRSEDDLATDLSDEDIDQLVDDLSDEDLGQLVLFLVDHTPVPVAVATERATA